jgi:F0F1-type ATP synthase alpha subunit
MNKYLTLGLSLLPVVVIFIGMIGWIFTLRADLDTVIEAWERDNVEVIIGDMRDSLAELERIQAIQKNEMESIMADHSYMGEILEELGERLPPGERRQYGNY